MNFHIHHPSINRRYFVNLGGRGMVAVIILDDSNIARYTHLYDFSMATGSYGGGTKFQQPLYQGAPHTSHFINGQQPTFPLSSLYQGMHVCISDAGGRESIFTMDALLNAPSHIEQLWHFSLQVDMHTLLSPQRWCREVMWLTSQRLAREEPAQPQKELSKRRHRTWSALSQI